VRPRTQLSVLQIVTWGVMLGFALAEWTGNVTAPRVRRAARRIREPAPPPALTAAGTARAVADALGRDAELHDLGIQVTMVSAGTVELHGWVRTRALRARAARVAARVPGVEAVINSILVRGEDDRTYLPDYLATDQSA
jgi:hypothetical protein